MGNMSLDKELFAFFSFRIKQDQQFKTLKITGGRKKKWFKFFLTLSLCHSYDINYRLVAYGKVFFSKLSGKSAVNSNKNSSKYIRFLQQKV